MTPASGVLPNTWQLNPSKLIKQNELIFLKPSNNDELRLKKIACNRLTFELAINLAFVIHRNAEMVKESLRK